MRHGRKGRRLAEIVGTVLVVAIVVYIAAAILGKSVIHRIPAGEPLPTPAGGEGRCEVHFIDVGQGDSALILSDGHAILIDGGEPEAGAAVSDYLQGLGIEKLDLMIASHPHSDHIGGLKTVLEDFPVDTILMSRPPDELIPLGNTYPGFLRAAARKQMKLTPASAGNSYSFGKGTLQVLGPVESYADLNNGSLVCRFEYDGWSFLFTGDMEETEELSLVQNRVSLRSDVLKVGHHGSSGSTTWELYDEVSPSVCVISAGEGNPYGHPHELVLGRIASNGAQIYRTDFQGSIAIALVDGELSIKAEGESDTRRQGKDEAA